MCSHALGVMRGMLTLHVHSRTCMHCMLTCNAAFILGTSFSVVVLRLACYHCRQPTKSLHHMSDVEWSGLLFESLHHSPWPANQQCQSMDHITVRSVVHSAVGLISPAQANLSDHCISATLLMACAQDVIECLVDMWEQEDWD